MAFTSLHINPSAVDVPRADVQTTGSYAYIVLHFGEDVAIFFPDGVQSSAMARTIAEALLIAADRNDVLGGRDPRAPIAPVPESEANA